MFAIDDGSTNTGCCGGGTGGSADGTGMAPTGPGVGVVPNRCAADVDGPVASELAADVTSLGGGALWN